MLHVRSCCTFYPSTHTTIVYTTMHACTLLPSAHHTRLPAHCLPYLIGRFSAPHTHTTHCLLLPAGSCLLLTFLLHRSAFFLCPFYYWDLPLLLLLPTLPFLHRSFSCHMPACAYKFFLFPAYLFLHMQCHNALFLAFLLPSPAYPHCSFCSPF